MRNAVENPNSEISTCFDFRNVSASIKLNEKNEIIKVTSESDFQIKQLVDILRAKLLKSGIKGAAIAKCRKRSCTAVKAGTLKRS